MILIRTCLASRSPFEWNTIKIINISIVAVEEKK